MSVTQVDAFLWSGCVPSLAPGFFHHARILTLPFLNSGFWFLVNSSFQLSLSSFLFFFLPFPALNVMKFGSQLKEAIYPEWQHAYMDYDGLKKKLQKADKDNPFSERDETEFVEQLDSNLEMVRKEKRRSG
jgi:hypothetical protein